MPKNFRHSSPRITSISFNLLAIDTELFPQTTFTVHFAMLANLVVCIQSRLVGVLQRPNRLQSSNLSALDKSSQEPLALVPND